MDSSGSRLVLYSRSGGRLPPRDRERLEIFEDGTFQMWRSIGAASLPASPVGLFQGKIPGALWEQIAPLAAASARAGSLEIVPVPDAAVDSIELGSVQARLGQHDQPQGAWGQLAAALRDALGSLTSQALAAVSLEVSADGRRANLHHLGTQPLSLDLSKLQVRAVLWQGYAKLGDWRPSGTPAGLPGRLEAAPGWTFDLPFDHGFDPQPGQAVAAYVVLTLFDGQQPIPASLEARS